MTILAGKAKFIKWSEIRSFRHGKIGLKNYFVVLINGGDN
jgi:hypothetical protein